MLAVNYTEGDEVVDYLGPRGVPTTLTLGEFTWAMVDIADPATGGDAATIRADLNDALDDLEEARVAVIAATEAVGHALDVLNG